jgi:hypothetical protein
LDAVEERQAAADPPVADGLDHQLDPRVIPLQRIVGAIVVVVVGMGSLWLLLGVWMAAWLEGDASAAGLLALLPLWAAGVGALAWHLYRWPPIAYRFASYRVDDQGLEIRSGVYWRRVVNVPRSRVQHTDVSQGPLQRSYGLGTLVVYTAGTEHARVELSGLDHARALHLREHLLPREGADAV